MLHINRISYTESDFTASKCKQYFVPSNFWNSVTNLGNLYISVWTPASCNLPEYFCTIILIWKWFTHQRVPGVVWPLIPFVSSYSVYTSPFSQLFCSALEMAEHCLVWRMFPMDDGTNNNQVTDLLSLVSYLELYQQYLPLYNSAVTRYNQTISPSISFTTKLAITGHKHTDLILLDIQYKLFLMP